MGRDPLGRTGEGAGAVRTDAVNIPSEAEVKRAREILDELRRRAANRNRPQVEREYLDRLLRRF